MSIETTAPSMATAIAKSDYKLITQLLIDGQSLVENEKVSKTELCLWVVQSMQTAIDACSDSATVAQSYHAAALALGTHMHGIWGDVYRVDGDAAYKSLDAKLKEIAKENGFAISIKREKNAKKKMAKFIFSSILVEPFDAAAHKAKLVADKAEEKEAEKEAIVQETLQGLGIDPDNIPKRVSDMTQMELLRLFGEIIAVADEATADQMMAGLTAAKAAAAEAKKAAA